ncbi:HutD family protein [Streptomyces sp. AK02-01A]|uniref:HutD/Ves family protein n=1 Tax=Streptomyces sp. AK02-01A TaxID=3028648 RepID=UPI0029CAA6C6|nr:HutD family protein [Streptomyces sp. AK02-01A]
MPWKNGGGVTREIASWPEDAGSGGSGGFGGFDWRISLAEVAADGPFSAFPGVDRTLTVVEGAGLDLTVDGGRRLAAERYAPLRFPGDLPADCVLRAGPVVNVNVMCRRGRTTAVIAVVQGSRQLVVPPGATVVAVALEGPTALGDSILARYDAAVLTPGEPGAGPATLRTGGCAALVTLRPA